MRRIISVLVVALMGLIASDTLFAFTVSGGGRLILIKPHAGRVSILGGSAADYQSVRDAVELSNFPAANEEGNRWLNTVYQAEFDVGEESLCVESEDATPLVRTARPIADNQLPQGVGVPENGCSVSLQAQLSVADEPLATQPTNALFSVWPYSEEDSGRTNLMAWASDGIVATNFTLVPEKFFWDWHRLEIRMIPTVMKGGMKLPGFYIKDDGSPLTNSAGSTCSSAFLSEHANNLKSECLADIQAGTLFLSACGTNLTSYVGTAFIGDLMMKDLAITNRCAIGSSYTENVNGVGWIFTMSDAGVLVGGAANASGAVMIPESSDSVPVVGIADHAFEGCRGLKSVTIPSSVTNVGVGAFLDCRDLTSVTLAEGVVGIGESAFENCRRLETMTIPDSVVKIDAYAFYGCGRLKTMTYLGEKPEIEDAAFEGTGVVNGSAATTVNVIVTNIIVQYVFNSVQPQFANPASSDRGFVNIIAEVKGSCVPVPESWAEDYPSFKSMYGSDFTKALAAKTGKKDGAGNDMLVWQDYVAGTDPTNEKDVFTASITLVDGKIKISHSPELDDERKALRMYTTWGKKSLLEATWTEVAEGQESEYNFYKVSVEMRPASEL